ncbi:tripartite tricarboxylate transporter TctB family protein [Marinomonas algicola]|jgi:putative tricarboxylic transport membrane protein|uniref:tripartite tricarboxylate transporter TctB family protein n=1 Tax=Marinomonas algicola TaxID=2773454 RepID=UPI00174B14B9|nr:tripartite tricarboxylate transporter TctB family protein [Marinomonas algicola]
MRLNDRVFGILMLILAFGYGWEATQFPEPFGGGESVGPETFPIILSFLLGISAVYLILKPDPDEAWPASKMLLELSAVALAILVFAWAIEPIGFIPAAIMIVSYLCWRMGAKPKNCLLTGTISSVVMFLIFNNMLELALPLGLLEF